jgi:hypothetical protein
VKSRDAIARGGLTAAACTACCAPPIIAGLGLVTGLLLAVAVFMGIASAVAVAIIGGRAVVARRRRSNAPRSAGTSSERVELSRKASLSR